ncbi:hypothetical protein H1C71_039664, partial [Ictidomys tridecemlineatus]
PRHRPQTWPQWGHEAMGDKDFPLETGTGTEKVQDPEGPHPSLFPSLLSWSLLALSLRVRGLPGPVEGTRSRVEQGIHVRPRVRPGQPPGTSTPGVGVSLGSGGPRLRRTPEGTTPALGSHCPARGPDAIAMGTGRGADLWAEVRAKGGRIDRKSKNVPETFQGSSV